MQYLKVTSLQHQAAHAFIKQHDGKSKQQLLVEISKIPAELGVGVIDLLLHYMVHNVVLDPPAAVRLITRHDVFTGMLWREGRDEFLEIYGPDTREYRDITTWCDLPNDVRPDFHGFLRTSNGILYDPSRRAFIYLVSTFPYVTANIGALFGLGPYTSKGQIEVFEESILPADLLELLEESSSISPQILVPRSCVYRHGKVFTSKNCQLYPSGTTHS